MMNQTTDNAEKTLKIITEVQSETFYTGQCEACAPLLFSPDVEAPDIRTAAEYKIHPELIIRPVDGNHHAVLSPFHKTFSVLNRPAMALFQEIAAHPRRLPADSSPIAQMIRGGILIESSHEVSPPVESHGTLAAWLHITDRCNFRCRYCYLPHHRRTMPVSTGYAAVDAIFRSARYHGYRNVKLKYAGGEPLLAFDTIDGIHRYATDAAEKKAIRLEGVILTNGSLITSRIAKALKRNCIRLMISLDGIGDAHDSQRSYANGKPSSENVLAAIETALSHDVVPLISVTVGEANAQALPNLVGWLLERHLPFSLNFVRETEKARNDPELLDHDRIKKAMIAAYRVVESNWPKYSLKGLLVDRGNLSAAHLKPCSAGHSYLAIDCYGRIARCQMQFGHSMTTIYADDPLGAIRSSKNGLQNLPVTQKAECKDCDWKYICAGGCPLDAFRANGRYDGPSPRCLLYRELYPEVVRLEGLRLLEKDTA